jgi:hypothetical protein
LFGRYICNFSKKYKVISKLYIKEVQSKRLTYVIVARENFAKLFGKGLKSGKIMLWCECHSFWWES